MYRDVTTSDSGTLSSGFVGGLRTARGSDSGACTLQVTSLEEWQEALYEKVMGKTTGGAFEVQRLRHL